MTKSADNLTVPSHSAETGNIDIAGQHQFPFAFGERFLTDHAGQIISDPQIAVVELVANAYDAGATIVDISWPEISSDFFEVKDNGTGMTPDEFMRRWKTWNYDRPSQQGEEVVFPEGTKPKSPRKAFGQAGKGRHGAFCFANAYCVETWKNGKSLTAKIEWTNNAQEPFHCQIEKTENREQKAHGTRVFGKVTRHRIEISSLRDVIGSKFAVDPSFKIAINGFNLQLIDLSHITTKTPLKAETGDDVVVLRIDSTSQDRTTKLRGVTWWVRGKMVGQPSWEGLDQRGAILDGRSQAAKRYSFIVQADCLKPDIKPDWVGFHDTPRVLAVRKVVQQHVIRELDGIFSEVRTERKKVALNSHRDALRELPRVSQRAVGQFIDEIQQKCPGLSDSELEKTVEIFASFEKAKSGYELLHKLAACSADDLDTWNRLMDQWTADNAEIVLSELKRRLDLIAELRSLVNEKVTDELHDLQPLFARGLWIFGPEYESVEFTSNRSMATAIGKLLGGTDDILSRRRPDFVVIGDCSVSAYSADRYREGEIIGVRKVLVIELKKGGFEVTGREVFQGSEYPKELRKGDNALADTEFVVFVLGATLGNTVEEMTSGRNITINPTTYDTILRRAEARTFNLHKRLSAIRPPVTGDKEVDEVISSAEEPTLDFGPGRAKPAKNSS